MIDSHSHIYLEQFKPDLEEVMNRAFEEGVTKIFMPNIDSTSIEDMLEVEQNYPEVCHSMMGLHPCSVKKDFEKELYIVENWLNNRKWSAIGEIGLDLYWDKTTLEIQIEALKIQIEWARKYEIPFVIHCRDAFEEIFDVLENMDLSGLNAVFHCFTGTKKDLERINALGFYIGIGGVITFKNQSISSLGADMNKAKLMLETDSPYLAPSPNRGKRNEPSYLKYISERLAEVLEIEKEELVELTDKNALSFFPN